MELLTVIHNKIFYSFLCLSFCFIQDVKALEGTYKTYVSAIEDLNEDNYNFALTNTFRPKITWNANERLTLYAAYALSADLQKKDALVSITQDKRGYRFADLDNELYSKRESSDFRLTQNLDRFYLSYSYNKFNINVGRAPIAFGSAKIVNPTDVLTPISYQTIDKEERVGVDTIRVNITLGALSLLDIGHVFGDEFKFSKSATFIRYKTNFLKTDASAMVMDFQENFLYGIDLARSIGSASAWLEMAHVLPKKFKKNNPNDLDDYFRATIGTDYKLTPALYSYIEYHYNGAGAEEVDGYIFLPANTAYKEGGVTLQAEHYIIPGMTYELDALWKLTGQFLYNVKDSSVFANTSVEYNVAEDMYLDLGAYIPFGKEPDPFVRSEFGVYPKVIYSSFRWYF